MTRRSPRNRSTSGSGGCFMGRLASSTAPHRFPANGTQYPPPDQTAHRPDQVPVRRESAQCLWILATDACFGRQACRTIILALGYKTQGKSGGTGTRERKKIGCVRNGKLAIIQLPEAARHPENKFAFSVLFQQREIVQPERWHDSFLPQSEPPPRPHGPLTQSNHAAEKRIARRLVVANCPDHIRTRSGNAKRVPFAELVAWQIFIKQAH